MTTGLSHEGFDIDLRNGLAREEALVDVMLRARVEVKSDKQAAHTGNIFVELRQKTIPSGAAITKADRWATEYRPDCWLIVTMAELDRLIDRALREGKTARGGDFNRYDGVLIPLAWFMEPTR